LRKRKLAIITAEAEDIPPRVLQLRHGAAAVDPSIPCLGEISVAAE